MINVTLTFADVSELLTFFTSIQAPASGIKVESAPALEVSPAPAPKSKKAAPSPAPAEPVAPPPVTAPLEEAPAPAVVPEPAPEPEANAEPAPADVSYADLQKAVLALYAKDRGAAQAIATGMGFASYKVMPAERWAEALANVNAALGA